MLEIYSFGLGKDQPTADHTADNLGGKGAGLMLMQQNGINVPPGFILPTYLWKLFTEDEAVTMASIAEAIEPFLAALKAKFGFMPLLSVRSGARVSCPGMMDTILNVGLDPTTHHEWEERVGGKCAVDCAKRLVEMYGVTVKGLDKKALHGGYIERREAYEKLTGEKFPDAKDQILGAIAAVFRSWNNERAKLYRKEHKIPDEWGTAVTVQAMVFGNLNDKSCTGVLFTRDPDSGAKSITGEFAINAQGEDVVNGSTTPMKLVGMHKWNDYVAHKLIAAVTKLEQIQGYPQDVEFTIQDGELYILQTRKAKRSARAGLVWAVDLHQEGVLDLKAAITSITAKEYDLARRPVVDPKFTVPPSYTGIAACQGVAQGVIVRSSEQAVASAVPCVLVTGETNPDDLKGMLKAKGILTMTGGMTSHAAVVARSLNKPTIVGLGKELNNFPAGAKITLDGGSGRVWVGTDVPVVEPGNDKALQGFQDMLRKAGGAPLISNLPQDLPDYLYVADALAWPKKAVVAMIEFVAKQKPVKVVFDSARADLVEFYEMLGVTPVQRAQDILDDCKGMPWVGNVTPIIKNLTHSTIKTPIKDLDSLVLAEGDYEVDPVFAKTPAAAKLLVWKQQNGQGPKKPAVPTAEEKPLSDAQLTVLLGS